MGFRRTPVKHFELANPGYAGASVSFYAVDLDTYERTSDLITLYDNFSGTSAVANPYSLDSDGKFSAAVYFEEPYIAVVNGSNVEDHELGLTIPQASGYQGTWVESETYAQGDLVLDGLVGANTGNLYICETLHVSEDWATDLIDGKWSLVLDSATLLQSVSLALLADLTPAENKVPYFSSDSEADLLTVTTATKALLALSSESAIRSFLSLVIGTNVQAYSSNLDAFAAKTAPSGTIVGNGDAQTLTNKTFDASANTLTNLATSMFAANVIDTDSTFTANSNTRIPTQAAVKTAIDNAQSGLNYHADGEAVAATTTTLPSCTYDNGSSGVGASLLATANGAFPTIDGVTVNLNDYILVKDQASPAHNGVYELVGEGDGSNPWALQRGWAADEGDELAKLTINVSGGSTNQGVWRSDAESAPTVGTTTIYFNRISSPGITNADEVTLTKTGNTLSVLHAALLSLTALTPAANKLAYYTSGSAAALADLTAAGRALLDDADAAAQRTTLSAAARTQDIMFCIPIPSLTSDITQPLIQDNKLGTITITQITTKCSSGTMTVTGKIDGVSLGGTANSMSSSEQTQNHSSANTIATGSDFAVDLSSVSTIVGGIITIKGSVALA